MCFGNCASVSLSPLCARETQTNQVHEEAIKGAEMSSTVVSVDDVRFGGRSGRDEVGEGWQQQLKVARMAANCSRHIQLKSVYIEA